MMRPFFEAAFGGRPKDALAFVRGRERPTSLLLSLQQGISAICVKSGRMDMVVPTLAGFAHTTADDDPLKPFILFSLAGAIAVYNEDLAACDYFLQSAAKTAVDNLKQISALDPDAYNNVTYLLQQAFYFKHDLDVTETFPLPCLFDLSDLDIRGNGPIVLASCNGLYLDLYGARLAASCDIADHLGGIHILVSNATNKTLRILEEIRQNSRHTVSWSIENTEYGVAYLAVARFLQAHKIMSATGLDLIITDIDGEFLKPEALSMAMLPDEADCGLFERNGNIFIQQICHCPISYWRNTSRTQLFLRYLANYISDRLAVTDRFFCIDQTALYIISRRASFGDLRRLFGPTSLKWQNLSATIGSEEPFHRNDDKVNDRESLRRNHDANWQSLKGLSFKMDDGRLIPVGTDP